MNRIRRAAAYFDLKKWSWEILPPEKIASARGKYVLRADAGLRVPIKEADLLIAAIDSGCDVAAGSRRMSDPRCDVQRSLGGRLAGFFLHFLDRGSVKGMQDARCPFQCFRLEAAQAVFQGSFLSEVQALSLAQKKGLRVREIAVMWKD